MQKMKLIMMGLLSLILLNGCGGDDETGTQPGFSINLVTGIQATNENGEALMNIGNPNDKISTERNGLALYPNPVVDILCIRSDANITNAWFIKGTVSKSYKNFDFDSYYETHSADTTGLSYNNPISLNIESRSTDVDVSGLSTGYYKVVIEVDDSALYWASVYVSPPFIDFDGIKDYWE